MAHAGLAFDSLASRYDETWTRLPAGRLQRDAVWRNVAVHFKPHHEVLDLGCGTGEDAAWLAGHGIRVLAVDASPAMVAEARKRGVNAQVCNIENVDQLLPRFNGILSNFGAFNCVEQPQKLRNALSARLVSGGTFALCAIGRFCLWETIWYSLRGRFRKAVRRWKGRAHAESLGITVAYHSVAALRSALAPDFNLTRVVGIGIAVPPSYVTGLPPRLVHFLAAVDRILERIPFMSMLADHRLLIFERK